MHAAQDGREPELAVVLLSYGNESTIVAAARSVLDQDVPVELVVSHSGVCGSVALLAAALPGVRVLASDRRRLPGEARNVGARATRAPVIAFLEGDSFAQPGWAAGRLARHRSGAAAVGGAVGPDSLAPAAVAAHFQRNWRRMTHMPPPPRHLRFWVSFDRALLDRAGPFDPRLARSEDTAMNNRLAEEGAEIAWAPEVVITTTYPRSARELWREQVRRGRLWSSVAGGPLWRLAGALGSFHDAVAGPAHALRPGSPLPRRAVVRALPLVALGALATALGRTLGGPAPAGADLARANAARRARIERLRRRPARRS